MYCFPSAWRPTHTTPAQQMQMDMVDALASVNASVHDQTIAPRKTLARGNIAGGSHQVTQKRGVLVRGVCVGRYVLPGYQQQMRRRLGMNVGKTEAEVVLIDPLNGNLCPCNFAEKTIIGHVRRLLLGYQSMLAQSVPAPAVFQRAKYFGCSPALHGS
jgi:hypothetical protein